MVRNGPEMSVRCQGPQVACMNPSYIYEMLTSLPLHSCSLLWAPLLTVLGPYNPLFRMPDMGACLGHTQNSRRFLVIKISHGYRRLSISISNLLLNRCIHI